MVDSIQIETLKKRETYYSTDCEGGKETAGVAFVVPGAPRGWQRTGQKIARNKKTGKNFIRNFTPSETRAEEAGISYIASAAMRGRPLLCGSLVIETIAYVPIPPSWSKKRQRDALEAKIFPETKPDFDNIAKLVGDSLNYIVYRDDSQVSRSTFEKLYSDLPRLEVRVYPRVPGPSQAAAIT